MAMIDIKWLHYLQMIPGALYSGYPNGILNHLLNFFKTVFHTVGDGEFHPCLNYISSATKSESSGNGYKATPVN